jgi:hypothetical protein
MVWLPGSGSESAMEPMRIYNTAKKTTRKQLGLKNGTGTAEELYKVGKGLCYFLKRTNKTGRNAREGSVGRANGLNPVLES